MTLQDVADRAGVSLTTASRVVNHGSRRVGKTLADRVNKAMTDLGYTANLQARAVATGQSTMIGVALRDISDPYFSSIAGAHRGRRRGAAPGMHVEHRRARGGRARVRRADARPAGTGGRPRRQQVGQHAGQGRAARGARRVHQVRRAGRLHRPGHARRGHGAAGEQGGRGRPGQGAGRAGAPPVRRAGLPVPLTARDRTEGFRDGLRAWSVPLDPARIAHGDLSRDGGYQAMSEILAAREPLPDCVFAVSDIMAVGALARLRAAGLDVPGDIALAGFDDIPTLRDVYPPLTTVRLPLKRLGEIAARLVLDGDAPQQPRVVPVPGEVVLRDSTLPHPPTAG